MRRLLVNIRPFLEPTSVPLLFIIGVILLNLTSNAAYDWAKTWLVTPHIVILCALCALLLLVVIYALVRRFKRRLTVRDISPRRGLVVLVSQGRLADIPATAAMNFHSPALEHCWLITSPEPLKPPPEPSQSAWKNASELKAKYHGKVKTYVKVIDPEDPQSIFQAVEQVYAQAKHLDLSSKEIVADFTGGTKMMTAGMVLACTPDDRDVQYMKPLRFTPDGRADHIFGAEPRWVDLNFFLGKGDSLNVK
jgi:hypothetical protein